MLIASPANPAETGPQGARLAAQAEKMEALLWEQVLTCMTKSALSSGSLGTGADLYNGLATRAMAGSMFGATESRLTGQIVGELKQQIASANTGADHSTLSTLAQRETEPGVDKTHAQAIAFAKSAWPAIKTQAAALGVPPVALLAQSALETGWGASSPGNNLFGIKATAGQSGTLQNTQEEINGTLEPATASFANYASGSDCVAQYASLIRRAYPDALGAGSVSQYANALANGGYATDSGYAQKIVDLAQSPTMQTVLNAIEGNS
ncbi:flagellar biosynthesis protein FlgJ [Thioclava sp. BHET1]|nr:flagellar biosynthesis protein FlgJ [Thioclava sp. BHET1]